MKSKEVYITSAKRTAIGSLSKSLKNISAEEPCVSKSQRRREALELKSLAAKLMDLSPAQLARAPRGDRLKSATGKNPTGFFEDQEMLDVAKRVRSRLGLRTDSVSLLDAAAWQKVDLTALENEVVDIVDRRFRGDQLVEIAPDTRIAGEAFGRLGCGRFHGFWWKR